MTVARPRARLSLWVLVCFHLLALTADFVAPYDGVRQDRQAPFAPPTRVRWVDASGDRHWRPFVHPWVETRPGSGEYREDRSRRYPVRLLPRGEPRTVVGDFQLSRQLFGVDPPARIFLLGSDAYGRDRFSRLLYGARISLFSGLLAALLSVLLGLGLGSVAGFYGGWVDRLLMRSSELFLALPWLYLLFGARAFLPLSVDSRQAFLLFIGLIGLVGWARPARLFRGVVLGLRGEPFVEAARAGGASDWRLLRAHLLPQTRGVALTQLSVLVPQYVLAEVTLSFLGLVVGEPHASWGTLLADASGFYALRAHPWMLLPAVALVILVAAYQSLAVRLSRRARADRPSGRAQPFGGAGRGL